MLKTFLYLLNRLGPIGVSEHLHPLKLLSSQKLVASCPIPLTIIGLTSYMYLVAIAWMYVVVLMSLTEATNTNGSVLGAIVTLICYGFLPLALVLYLMKTPQRRKKRRQEELLQGLPSENTDSHTSRTPQDSSISSVRKE